MVFIKNQMSDNMMISIRIIPKIPPSLGGESAYKIVTGAAIIVIIADAIIFNEIRALIKLFDTVIAPIIVNTKY